MILKKGRDNRLFRGQPGRKDPRDINFPLTILTCAKSAVLEDNLGYKEILTIVFFQTQNKSKAIRGYIIELIHF